MVYIAVLKSFYSCSPALELLEHSLIFTSLYKRQWPVTTAVTGGFALWASAASGMRKDPMWLSESSFLSQGTHWQAHPVLCYIFQIKDASSQPEGDNGRPTWGTQNYKIICEQNLTSLANNLCLNTNLLILTDEPRAFQESIQGRCRVLMV